MRKMSNLVALIAAVTLLAACGGPKPPTPSPETAPAAAASDADAAAEAQAKEKQALEAGVEAVVYGLPLVIMDITRAKTSNVARPEGFAAPVNQFVNVREFPDASFRDVVRANVDTLYSSAWLDLSKEPIVLSVPDTKGRYYLMPMMDAWTNIFASPGKRTTGTKPGHFAITGPGWSGTLPGGVTELKSPTNMVWIIGRTQTNGPGDYAAVHAIQDGFKLVPLSSFGKPYTPPEGTVDPSVDMKTAPVDQLKAMSSETFFNRMAALLKSNPPPASEAPLLEKLEGDRHRPGREVRSRRGSTRPWPGDSSSRCKPRCEKLDGRLEGDRRAGERLAGSADGARQLRHRLRHARRGGADRARREPAAGCRLPVGVRRWRGQPLDGANRYVIHFDKDSTPPVNAFWSITMYDANSFFVANPINRYAISSWMPLKKNADGSLDIYVQAESPGKDKESNWLPAASGPFNLTLRMYWPTETPPSIMDGSWKPPAVTKVQ